MAPDLSGRYCKGFEEVLNVYSKSVPHINLSGPTNFAPIIHKAISIVKNVKDYHVKYYF